MNADTALADPVGKGTPSPATESDKSASVTSDDDLLAEARKRYQLALDANSDNRTAALDDLLFLSGEHWPADSRVQRSIEGRPCLTVNTLPTYLHQVTNDQRQNKPSIKVHPVDDGADPETAKVFQGMIRHIEYDSSADVAYDTAVNNAAAIGFGYWRWVTQYENDTSFDQVIKFERIRNPLSVKMDPLSTEPDGSDMKWCFLDVMMPRAEFEAEYPNAQAANWPLAQTMGYSGWWDKDNVLVAEYYRMEHSAATVCLLSDGSTGYKDDLVEPLPTGITIVKERPGRRTKVMWYKITGADVLDRREILSKWIPVFPVYGDEIDIQGKIIRSGLIRNAKDPAMMYDFWITSATEEVALRPKTPYIGAVGQFETAKEDWQQANNRSFAFIEYDPVAADGVVAPPPQRQPMADIPSGMLAMAMHASDNVKKTTGLFDSSLGAKGTATSGRQELAQQRQGDVANFHYTDNLMRSIRHCGRTLVYSIPKYYDAERTVRVLGDDDTADYAKINTPNVEGKTDELGEVRAVLNDLGAGTFDVTISTGPGFSTLRQEAAQAMAGNMEANPALWQVFGDLYVKNQDWPGADEAAERIKRTIPPAILGPEKDEQGEELIQTPHGPLPMSQAPQAIAQMDQVISQLEQRLQAQQNEQMAVQEEAAKVAAERVKIDADRRVMEADAKRMQAEIRAASVELDADGQKLMAAVSEKFTAVESALKDVANQVMDMAEDEAKENEMLSPEGVNAAGETVEQQAAENAQLQAVLGTVVQMHQEAQQTMQAALAAIAEARAASAARTLTITAPSGATYVGQVQ